MEKSRATDKMGHILAITVVGGELGDTILAQYTMVILGDGLWSKVLSIHHHRNDCLGNPLGMVRGAQHKLL